LRINEHYSDCTNYNHKFANALKKYGRGGFIWGVVEETDKLNEREVYWIEYYDSYGNGYNSTPGGQLSADYKCKEYLIENLNGDRELIFNLSNYCRDNDLNIGHLHETLYGKRLQHKGYKLIPRTEEEIKRYNDERLIRQDTSRKGLSGERNGRAKLDWNKVNQIRKLHSLKRHKNIQIAEMFGQFRECHNLLDFYVKLTYNVSIKSNEVNDSKLFVYCGAFFAISNFRIFWTMECNRKR
jgi:hypothetical protein